VNTSEWASRDLQSGLSHGAAGAGVFVTTFELDIPTGYDAPISFVFDNEYQPYRAWLFVNGWSFGKRVANLGCVSLSHICIIPMLIVYIGRNTDSQYQRVSLIIEGQTQWQSCCGRWRMSQFIHSFIWRSMQFSMGEWERFARTTLRGVLKSVLCNDTIYNPSLASRQGGCDVPVTESDEIKVKHV
jgi:hypothetical protein